jgi:hypothetical protein
VLLVAVALFTETIVDRRIFGSYDVELLKERTTRYVVVTFYSARLDLVGLELRSTSEAASLLLKSS